eukprot:COSAG01_NODE_1766_length_9274_cov_3.461094_4_plen_136_part_00
MGPPPGHDALGYAPPVLESPISTGGTEPSMPPPPEMSTEPSMPPPPMGMMEPQMPPPPLVGDYIAEGGLVNADIKIQLCGKRMGMEALKKIAFGGCAAAATSTRYRGDEHATQCPPLPSPPRGPPAARALRAPDT